MVAWKAPEGGDFHMVPPNTALSLAVSLWANLTDFFILIFLPHQDLSQGPPGLQKSSGVERHAGVLRPSFAGIGSDDLGLEIYFVIILMSILPKPSIQLLLKWRAIFQSLKN